MSTSKIEQSGPPLKIDFLSSSLFRVVSSILIFVACLLICGLTIQVYSYYGGLRSAVSVTAPSAGSTNPPQDLVDHAAVIAYARGLGAAFVKTSALFLGFILIFTGTLYVLRTSEAAYKLNISSGNAQGSFQTTSPGLVITTLGVILTVVALSTKSDVDYQKTIKTVSQPSGVSLPPSDTPANGAWIRGPAISGLPDPSGTEVHQ